MRINPHDMFEDAAEDLAAADLARDAIAGSNSTDQITSAERADHYYLAAIARSLFVIALAQSNVGLLAQKQLEAVATAQAAALASKLTDGRHDPRT